ncbi:hypothetical protein ACFX2C_026824 [Malus domestica]
MQQSPPPCLLLRHGIWSNPEHSLRIDHPYEHRRIHGLCIAICALTFWIGDIIIAYAFPVMLSSVGFASIFGIYVVGCIVLGYLCLKLKACLLKLAAADLLDSNDN